MPQHSPEKRMKQSVSASNADELTVHHQERALPQGNKAFTMGSQMNQAERRVFLIRALLAEQPERYRGMAIPSDEGAQARLLRALFNVRPPTPASPEFLRVQDAYLQEALATRGITDADALEELRPGVCRWRGDITTLRCDAIVNAANSALLASCYRACLDPADKRGLRSAAFCCISTGEFHFPNEPAARIAIRTICEHDAVRQDRIRVIFNVFKEQDESIYRIVSCRAAGM